MATIEDRLEQMVIAQVRTADALERIAKIMSDRVADKKPSPALENTPVEPLVGKKEKPIKKKEEPQAEVAPAISDLGQPEPVAQSYTHDDVAMALRNCIAKEGGKQTKAIELMVKYGASKAKPLVKDVKPENYAALIADVAAFIEV